LQFENLGKIPSSFDQHASCAGTFTTIVESVGVGEFFGEFLRLPLSTCILLEVENMLGIPPFFDQQASCVGAFPTIEVQQKRS
jgi:hypothetical protein